MRIGIIAPEFRSRIGGMESLAYGLANQLGAADDVSVFTFDAGGEPATGWRLGETLSGRLFEDARRLRANERDVEVWLALNGGLIPVAPLIGKPLFVYLHGNDFLRPWIGYGSWWLEAIRKPYMAKVRHSVRRAAMRRALPSVRHVFTNSRRTAELACERLHLAPERIAVCPPGVDDCFFQEHEPASEPTSLRLLTVTRLTKFSARKNVDGVLAAVAALKGRLPLRYTIVGDGDDAPRLRALAHQLDIEDVVEFAGSVTPPELLAWYRRSDLFILASKASPHDVEGFGIVYLEACAAGVPVICSEEGGATDAVTPGRNGLLLPSSSPEAIAEGILDFARTRERYRPQNVRASVESYRWPHTAARLRSHIAERLGAAAEIGPQHRLRAEKVGSPC